VSRRVNGKSFDVYQIHVPPRPFVIKTDRMSIGCCGRWVDRRTSGRARLTHASQVRQVNALSRLNPCVPFSISSSSYDGRIQYCLHHQCT